MVNTCYFTPCFVKGQPDEPIVNLQAANTAVNQAFSSILSAEKAGANVTSLLDQLNSANNLLAQAENSQRSGDNSIVLNDENAVLRIAQQVIASAQIATKTAQTDAKNEFWTTVAATIIAAVAFFLALYIVWRLVKRNYIIETV